MTENRKNIVVTYSPFAMEQTIYCWVDGDCAEQRKCGRSHRSSLCRTADESSRYNWDGQSFIWALQHERRS